MEHKSSCNKGKSRIAVGVVGAATLALSACGEDQDGSLAGSAQALTAECVAADASLPDGAWTCDDELTLECASGTGTVDPGVLYVPATDTECADEELSVTSGPFSVGTHEIVVSSGGAEVCATRLHVVDTQAPVVTIKSLNLWPPNHKFHSISVSDCVTVSDACDTNLSAEFVWASSDEPVDDIGDGHHAPDILVDDCQRVQLRAERQGPKDGRVYKLGVRVVDYGGNVTEGICTVIVDHDQRGVVGADSGESYRIELNGQQGQLACDGVNEPPVQPPVEEPPVEEPPVDQGPPGGEGPIDFNEL